MNLNSSKILLRPFEAEWAPHLYQWYYSGDYEEYFRHYGDTLKIDDFIAVIKDPARKLFAVWEKETDKLIGVCGLHEESIHDRQTKIMILLVKEVQTRGYAAQALLLMLDFVFGIRRYHKAGFNVLASNERLNRQLKEAGFACEAILKDSVWYQGRYQDENQYSLLEDDYRRLYLNKGAAWPKH